LTNTDIDTGSTVALQLLSAAAVRERCRQILTASAELEHFRVHMDRLDNVADYVIETIRENYPDMNVPFHSRWRHFKFAGVDRWKDIARTLDADADEIARIQFDIAVTSVFLDAGAGPRWSYSDTRTGARYTRSEGLALASLDSIARGLFSSSTDGIPTAEAAALQAIACDDLAAAFQVTRDNPLDGLDGRARLLRSLGKAVAAKPEFFSAQTPRIGCLYDWIKRTHGDAIEAADLLTSVLHAFGGIWAGRLEIDGVNLGDTWHHPAARAADKTDGLVPFHKLSQWLAYSLIEPLQDAGIRVTGVDGLTGLAEYRNGGLFVDMGVLEVKNLGLLEQAHNPGDLLIIEWRALTVALLDETAVIVRNKLGCTAQELPLASILEGGTWAAGRRIAAHLRPNAGPPIRIVSDGSVF